MTVATLSASDQTAAVQRRAMVDSQLRTNDVNDPALVAALLETAREPHLPEAARAGAYIDRAIPLSEGRALNPPLTTARLMADAGIFLWQFVGGQPIQNARRELKEIPARTAESDAMSKALLKRGFKFVGSTICYALMQAVGMVNDHCVDCPRWRELGGGKKTLRVHRP